MHLLCNLACGNFDLIISIVNRYIKDGYSNNLNDGERNGIRLNHYSKEYTENILKELSLLQKLYPGIPEMVMSLYRYKSENNINKIIIMPWGERLLSFSNILNMSETLKVSKSIYPCKHLANFFFIYFFDLWPRIKNYHPGPLVAHKFFIPVF